MLAPERLVPGSKAQHCAQPTLKASIKLISSTELIRASTGCSLFLRSIHKIINAPRIKAVATGTGANKCALIILPNNKPNTTAGKNATNKFKVNLRAEVCVLNPLITVNIRNRYSQHTASMAPA